MDGHEQPPPLTSGGTARQLQRRGLLATAAALVAGLLTKASEKVAQAADGDPLTLGIANTATSVTTLTRSAAGNTEAFRVEATSGIAVRGYGSATAGGVIGIAGIPTGTNPSVAAGVVGEGASMSHGVQGTTIGFASGGFAGVYGTSGPGYGVKGSSNMSYGVYGHSVNSTGVVGETSGFNTSPAVQGIAVGGIGARGHSSSGYGLSGVSTSSYGLYAQSSSNYGAYGYSTSSYGVVGGSGSSIGVYGYSPTSTGVFGSSNSSIGIWAVSNTSTALFAQSASGLAGYFNGGVVVNGSFTIVGAAKSAAVPHPDGSHRRLYCLEAPESYFEDFGTGRLSGGRADVRLDRDFAAVVHTDDYHVFLTEYDDHNALYVANRRPDGFEVRAKGSPSASGAFSYRLVARRKDITGRRLERVAVPPRPERSPAAPPVPLPAPSEPTRIPGRPER